MRVRAFFGGLTSCPKRRRRVCCTVLAAVMGVTMLSGCMGDPMPEPTVRRFLLAWQQGHYTEAAATTTGSTRQVATALQQAVDQLRARDLRMRIESIHGSGETAEATFLVRMWLDDIGRRWTYEGHLRLRQDTAGWKVVWSPSVIHPELHQGQDLAVVSDLPSRATVLDADGHPLVRATPVVTVGVAPNALHNRKHAISVLARTTKAKRGHIRTLIRSAGPDTFVPIATMRRSEYVHVRGQLEPIAGVRLHSGTLPLPRHPSFAGPLFGGIVPGSGPLGRGAGASGGAKRGAGADDFESVRLSGLQLAFRGRLSGTPGSKVISLSEEGRKAAVLATFPGRTSRPVRTTIDANAQRAAEKALHAVHQPAALVAVRASTGKIVAVANRPVDSTDNRAFVGKYRPGSAFEVVASAALLAGGLKLGSPVPCPDKRIVGGQTFRNQRSLASQPGTPSFRTNFTTSCTTAFVGLSRKLSGDALHRAAAGFGIGGRWQLPVSAFTGAVPSSSDSAARAAATIGLGDVRVSPLGMALVAAAVDSGTWHPPTLVTKPKQPPAAKPHPLNGHRIGKIRKLMRGSVETGTADGADLAGKRPVYGTTGTASTAADSGKKPHAWFVGYRGDIAIAVLVENGGRGSKVAAPIAADFFGTVDYDQVVHKPVHTRATD